MTQGETQFWLYTAYVSIVASAPHLWVMLAGYLAGSIPFGYVLSRAAGLGDIRAIGSGNIGATNVLRTGRKGLAAATLILDAAKGFLAVVIAKQYFGLDGAVLAGLGAFLGHLFPVWLGFRGGKGVATYIGVLLGLYWPAALAFCGIWLLVAVLTRYSSLSALVAASLVPVFLYIQQPGSPLPIIAALLSIMLIAKHHKNIRNLISGRESKIGERRT